MDAVSAMIKVSCKESLMAACVFIHRRFGVVPQHVQDASVKICIMAGLEACR